MRIFITEEKETRFRVIKQNKQNPFFLVFVFFPSLFLHGLRLTLSPHCPLLPVQAHHPEGTNPGCWEDCPSPASPHPASLLKRSGVESLYLTKKAFSCACPQTGGQTSVRYFKRNYFHSRAIRGEERVWLRGVNYFRTQDTSKETIHKVWVYLVGLRQAERKVWVRCKKQGSEIQTSDKATMKRFPAAGSVQAAGV